MSDERAGIYLTERAENAFYRLPEGTQKRLAAFLEGEREFLESTGGGRKEGLAFEWEPGYAVYWEIDLKPEYQAQGRMRKAPPPPSKLGAAYRIEVLEIRKLA
jgi:hypothetical protein